MSPVTAQLVGTGLEHLRRIVAGELPGAAMAELLGFRLVEVEPGRVTVVGRPDRRSYNLLGSVHGGWAAAVIDTALGLSVFSTLDETQAFTTVDIRVNYLRPLSADSGEVRAVGRLRHSGRRLAYAEAELVDASGRLVCHGTGSCLIVPR